MGLSVLCFAFKYDPVLGCIDPVDYWNYNPRLIAWPTHLVVFFYSWNFLSHWLSQGSSTRTLPSSRKEDKFNVGSRTKIFMAIGALIGEQHSFMHDLKSFFWVLFWICVHWNGLGEKGASRTLRIGTIYLLRNLQDRRQVKYQRAYLTQWITKSLPIASR
jgi:hypothetical protein